VNAAYLMLTTAWLAGQTPAPVAGQPAPAPVAAMPAPVVSTSMGGCSGGGCGSCATDCCDTGRKAGLLSRLFHHKSNDCGCAPAPAPCCSAPIVHKAAPCCTPAPVCAPAPSCGCGCEEKKPGLFARLHALCHKEKGCGCEAPCGTSCGCGGGAIGGTVGGAWSGTGAPIGAEPIQAPKTGGTGTAPQKMPTAGGTPMTINGVIRDVTPVVAPRLSIEQEGPRQPF